MLVLVILAKMKSASFHVCRLISRNAIQISIFQEVHQQLRIKSRLEKNTFMSQFSWFFWPRASCTTRSYGRGELPHAAWPVLQFVQISGLFQNQEDETKVGCEEQNLEDLIQILSTSRKRLPCTYPFDQCFSTFFIMINFEWNFLCFLRKLMIQ